MATKPKIYTKASLSKKLKQIAAAGWIANARHGNHGGVGNTLEDLLGLKENNLPIPNAAEWELKTGRLGSRSLTTLLHTEPSPRAIGFVPKVFLPNYGWSHQQAGKKYPKNEMSFRQTIGTVEYSDRGFKVVVNRTNKRIEVSFNAKKVDVRHKKWLQSVKKKVGLGELDPKPYWGFDDLEHIAGSKLPNCFYVQAELQRKRGKEFYKYSKIIMLQTFDFKGFLKALESGNLLLDFDARTRHNHGTKFRLRQNCLPMLYQKDTIIL
jgi:hypothetical protein